MPDYQDRHALAIAIADLAGRKTLEYFRTDSFRVERKSDNSPVTIADQEAERMLRAEVAAAFPHDAILGEEFGETDGDSGYRWIFDPIDGTKSFISGVPLYGTMIGVEHNGQAVIGVVNIPGLRECVHAARGEGAWYVSGEHEPRPTQVCDKTSLEDGLFVSSQFDSFAQRGAWDAYKQLEATAYITRTWGDCYGYLLVATGRAAAMVDPIMNVWDAAAIQPIMEEAGGAFTDWSGQPTIHSGEGIGASNKVLQQVLEITKPFAR